MAADQFAKIQIMSSTHRTQNKNLDYILRIVVQRLACCNKFCATDHPTTIINNCCADSGMEVEAEALESSR